MEKMFLKALTRLRDEQMEDGKRACEVEKLRWDMRFKRTGYFGR
jgi:hypothetical protein